MYNNENENTGGKIERYVIGDGFGMMAVDSGDAETATEFDGQDGDVSTKEIQIGGRDYEYVTWGDDDQMPYRLRNRVNDCMITAQSQFFNELACYGQGLHFHPVGDAKGAVAASHPLFMFNLLDNPTQTYLEMCVDMKFFFFSVVVLELSRDGKQIVHISHKEAQNCRITLDGKWLIYGNFEDGTQQIQKKFKVYPLLDVRRPAENLLVRTGRLASSADGMKKTDSKKKFAMMVRFPTVGFQFYPIPTYTAVFRDKWYDIYSLIGFGKRRKIRNAGSPRFQIEIHSEYWERLCEAEGITDEVKMRERIDEEKRKIEKFVCGIENTGKTWITEYYVDPNGKENRMVRIENLETSKKEGGDWADDINEASNMMCYAFGVHPNLIGATPGKSQMNNSGSDKRELFTLKQALETACRHVMLPPFLLMLYFNGWHEDYTVEIPIIQLTTLDENKDAKKVSTNNGGQGNED